ncbi:PIG-L deacetylase family protein [Marmoricola sp. RAF53]|uniref:PIG-L deacetylase family protein n=1 Tax=Marmoricola sp. RAF53 TaxID=3233059 RepID=UPI003F964057
MPFTLVAFHAHPDDESLLMGGSIARACAEGHRVVLVTATDGAAGLAQAGTTESGDLGRRRLAELEAAAAALGAARVVHLGYPDGRFGDCGTEEPAQALAKVLEQEGADLFTGYDPSGGYGHPDHVHLHRVARAAARLTDGVPLLEATLDRALLLRAARLVAAVPGAPPVDVARLRSGYLPRAELTHQVDVRPFVAAKIAGLAAHASQGTGSRGVRTVTLLRRLPGPIARRVLGREWFREVGVAPGLRDDLFASCR